MKMRGSLNLCNHVWLRTQILSTWLDFHPSACNANVQDAIEQERANQIRNMLKIIIVLWNFSFKHSKCPGRPISSSIDKNIRFQISDCIFLLKFSLTLLPKVDGTCTIIQNSKMKNIWGFSI